MDCYIALLVFSYLLTMFVSNGHRVPLMNNVQAPLLVDLDVSALNGDLENFIQQEVDDKCFENIDLAVRRRHNHLKSEIKKEMLASKTQNKNEIQDIKTQLQIKLKHELKSELEKEFKDEFSELKKEIADLRTKVMFNEQNVAFTGCVSTYSYLSKGHIIRFDKIIHHVGISDTNNITNGRKFYCDKPGLYIISTTITSVTSGANYYIYKNGEQVAHRLMAFSSGYHSTTALITLELDKSDTVWVQSGNTMWVYGQLRSCLSIIKIK